MQTVIHLNSDKLDREGVIIWLDSHFPDRNFSATYISKTETGWKVIMLG